MLDRIARQILTDTLQHCADTGALALETLPDVTVERPKKVEHGDYATSVAMTLTKALRMNPRVIAQAIVDGIQDPDGLLESVDIAGPGFINLRFRRAVWYGHLAQVAEADADWGKTTAGEGHKVLVEYVSANPTGPLHVGHGRGAVVGDVLSRVLKAAGFDVAREYYINDVGRQIWHLGRSLYCRYRELLGIEEPFPEDGYKGDYVRDIAQDYLDEHGEADRDADYGDEETALRFQTYIKERILTLIKEDLEGFGIAFDRWYRESTLYAEDKVHALLDELEERGHVYTDEETGARKFRTSAFDEKEDDRVLIRDNGIPTYFASDVAYHHDKFNRGFRTLIDVMGADHHGYIARMRASMTSLGHDPDALEFLLVQFVRLVEGGEEKKMSTRAGVGVDLKEVREKVGRDAARFFFIMRKADAQLDFDLELAQKASMDNPVYYVQYGHARICSILRKAAEAGYSVPAYRPEMADALKLPEELEIARRVLDYPAMVESCALNRETHHIVFYLQDAIKTFHSYYTRHKRTAKIVSDNPLERDARLFLVDSLRIVLRNALDLLGVTAPERMYSPADEDEGEDD